MKWFCYLILRLTEEYARGSQRKLNMVTNFRLNLVILVYKLGMTSAPDRIEGARDLSAVIMLLSQGNLLCFPSDHVTGFFCTGDPLLW